MKTQPFGQGFLADKLYNQEHPVPSGLFDAIQQNRKKRGFGVLWIFPLLLLIGITGLTLWKVGTAFENKDIAAESLTFNQKPALNPSKAKQTSTVLAPTKTIANEKGVVESESKKVNAESSFMVTETDHTKVDNGRSVKESIPHKINAKVSLRPTPYEKPRKILVSKLPNKIRQLLGNTGMQLAEGGIQTSQELKSLPNPPSLSHSNMRETEEPSQPIGVESSSVKLQENATNSHVTVPDMELASTLVYEQNANDLLFITSRQPQLVITPLEVSPFLVSPVPTSLGLLARIGLREVLIGLGPLAQFQQTKLKATAPTRPGIAEGTDYTTRSAEPGIGLDFGIASRTRLSSSFGLLVGLRTFFIRQTVSGEIIPTGGPVRYFINENNLIESVPVPTQGYTVQSTLWVPFAPELLVEYHLPRKSWGITGGVYALGIPQTYLSYSGTGATASRFEPDSRLQPMIQFYNNTGRTRIALTAKRIAGEGLLPHPKAGTSNGLLLTATMSYRLGVGK
jgi:hypothetical protein